MKKYIHISQLAIISPSFRDEPKPNIFSKKKKHQNLVIHKHRSRSHHPSVTPIGKPQLFIPFIAPWHLYIRSSQNDTKTTPWIGWSSHGVCCVFRRGFGEPVVFFLRFGFMADFLGGQKVKQKYVVSFNTGKDTHFTPICKRIYNYLSVRV